MASKRSGVRLPVSPPNFYQEETQARLAQSAEAGDLKSSKCGFESHFGHQSRPGDGIGIRTGLRGQVLWVRVPPGAPDLSTQSLSRRYIVCTQNVCINQGDSNEIRSYPDRSTVRNRRVCR